MSCRGELTDNACAKQLFNVEPEKDELVRRRRRDYGEGTPRNG